MPSVRTGTERCGLELKMALIAWTGAMEHSPLTQQGMDCQAMPFQRFSRTPGEISGWPRTMDFPDLIRRRRLFAIIRNRTDCRTISWLRTWRRAAFNLETVKSFWPPARA